MATGESTDGCCWHASQGRARQQQHPLALVQLLQLLAATTTTFTTTPRRWRATVTATQRHATCEMQTGTTEEPQFATHCYDSVKPINPVFLCLQLQVGLSYKLPARKNLKLGVHPGRRAPLRLIAQTLAKESHCIPKISLRPCRSCMPVPSQATCTPR